MSVVGKTRDQVLGESAAFPAAASQVSGLTKRELFAALAMQAVIGSGLGELATRDEVVADSIRLADALLEELEKGSSDG